MNKSIYIIIYLDINNDIYFIFNKLFIYFFLDSEYNICYQEKRLKTRNRRPIHKDYGYMSRGIYYYSKDKPIGINQF